MRRIAFLLLIFAFFVGNATFASSDRILVVPDNLANKPVLDTFVYEESAEFFANQVVNRLNLSGTIEAINISEAREKLSKNPRLNIATRESLTRFKNGYNINYLNVKKLGQMFGVNKVLLITTTADAQNYFMRRTFWDVLNVPGASVIDPAIKLSTYAVLIDTDRDVNLWEDTFYKTISSCEYRMVANSLEPQTLQLEKIRDYSRMLAPQIASNVQAHLVPKKMLNIGNTIDYGPKDFDNIFTKKYRWYKHGGKEIIKETNIKVDVQKKRSAANKALKEKQKALKEEKARQELQKERLQLDELRRQQQIKNINAPQIEIKEEVKLKPAVEVKPVTQTKELNVVKDDYMTPTDKEEELQLKYYQPKPRNIQHRKNTTINDI